MEKILAIGFYLTIITLTGNCLHEKVIRHKSRSQFKSSMTGGISWITLQRQKYNMANGKVQKILGKGLLSCEVYPSEFMQTVMLLKSRTNAQSALRDHSYRIIIIIYACQ